MSTLLTIKSNTPLHLAALAGKYKSVELLVAEGARIGIVNNKGSTPLQLLKPNVQYGIEEDKVLTAKVKRQLGGDQEKVRTVTPIKKPRAKK